jgi:tellurite resistance protein
MAQEFFPEIEVRDDQAEAIARGLYAVARADGDVHEREAALIADFYAQVDADPAAFSALQRAPRIEPAALALALPDAALRQLFVKTALLLAYADGTYSAGESKVVAEYARALEVGDADLRSLESQVKDFLLAQLSHLKNTEALVEVAKELKL